MIEPKQVRERAQKLYSDMKRRSQPTYWQSGPRRGRIMWPGAQLPSYSSDVFASWLLTEIGCNAFLCPYCSAPLDVISMTLDHDIPLKKGGDNEISNLVFCCSDCNELKGAMTGKGYRLFRAMLLELSESDAADLLKRLRYGLSGMRVAQQSHKNKKIKAQQPSLVTSDEPF
jgi:5-methylcytosine-specific restriction endonuclease McrA